MVAMIRMRPPEEQDDASLDVSHSQDKNDDDMDDQDKNDKDKDEDGASLDVSHSQGFGLRL